MKHCNYSETQSCPFLLMTIRNAAESDSLMPIVMLVVPIWTS